MKQLRVTPTSVRTQAERCAGLAGTLADGSAPSVVGSSWLSLAAAVETSHARAGTARAKRAAVMQQASQKLSSAADAYGGIEAGAADALDRQMRAR